MGQEMIMFILNTLQHYNIIIIGYWIFLCNVDFSLAVSFSDRYTNASRLSSVAFNQISNLSNLHLSTLPFIAVCYTSHQNSSTVFPLRHPPSHPVQTPSPLGQVFQCYST